MFYKTAIMRYKKATYMFLVCIVVVADAMYVDHKQAVFKSESKSALCQMLFLPHTNGVK